MSRQNYHNRAPWLNAKRNILRVKMTQYAPHGKYNRKEMIFCRNKSMIKPYRL